MSILSDKLRALGVQQGAQNLPPPRRKSQAYAIENVIVGRFQATPHGDVFVVEKGYDSSYRHGKMALKGESSLEMIATWARDRRLSQSPLAQFAFLDTETTGLAGGTGTYAFLVGVGRFEGDKLQLAQFFMRDPSEEAALLVALTEFLQPCQVLVTFNGKAFDAPLLNTRYTLNRQVSPLLTLAHLDLLPLARRLWPDRLDNHRLGTLETQLLGAQRTEEDIPGWLIPSIYFGYLRQGDARALPGVFYHNAMDVLTMAALLNHAAQLLADPLNPSVEHALDIVALGQFYENMGDVETAAQLFEQGLARNDLPEAHYWATQRRLSFLHKRHQHWIAAVELWQLAAEGRQIYAHVELAKFYEHQQRNYDEAILWTQTALNLLTAHERSQWWGDLHHRLARLQRKAARNQ